MKNCKLNQLFSERLADLSTQLAAQPLPLMPLDLSRLGVKNPNCVSVTVLREDLRHSVISGNKWHKLYPHIQVALAAGKTALLGFGGPYSNLLHALAYCGHVLGMPTIGVIRGGEVLTPTLAQLKAWDMGLRPVTRADYRERHKAAWIAQWQARYPEAHIIVEGGGGLEGLSGCVSWGRALASQLAELPITDSALVDREFVDTASASREPQLGGFPELAYTTPELAVPEHLLAPAFDIVAVAAGTGVSAQGLSLGLQGASIVVEAYVVHRDTEIAERNAALAAEYLCTRAQEADALVVDALVVDDCNALQYVSDYAGRGFAKASPQLIDFARRFQEVYGEQIQLDRVYTAKLFYGVCDRIAQGVYPKGTRLLVVHTGGLQGGCL